MDPTGVRHEDEQPFRSGGSGIFWLLQLLDKVSPSQWAAIGVLASIFLGLITYLTNLYFKIKEDRRKEAQLYDQHQD